MTSFEVTMAVHLAAVALSPSTAVDDSYVYNRIGNDRSFFLWASKSSVRLSNVETNKPLCVSRVKLLRIRRSGMDGAENKN